VRLITLVIELSDLTYNKCMKKKKALLILLIAIVALLVLFFAWNQQTQHNAVIADVNLPGVQTSSAPWGPEIAHLSDRLQILGLPEMKAESNIFHIHQHLDIFIHGQKMSVPADIGINGIKQYFSPIHTHDTTGIMHIESAVMQTFTLGQFFDIWGARFTNDCLGGYCTDATNILSVYSDGSLIHSNPQSLALTPHEEIVIAYGTKNELPQPIPSSYVFPPGD
jgi:hypothetical protein